MSSNFTTTREDRMRPVSTPDVAAHEPARRSVDKLPSKSASVAFNLLDPIPYGFFVGALIFDAIYDRTGEVLWFKSAAWLITFGLLFAVLPRLINLARVWFTGDRIRADGEMVAFWLNLLAIGAAIVNAFVHSRDAYAVMPEGLWLSCATVALMVIARFAQTMQHSAQRF